MSDLQRQAALIAAQKRWERITERAQAASQNPNDFVLRLAIDDSIRAIDLLPEVRADLEEAMKGASPEHREYLVYQQWLAEMQLRRASEGALQRREYLRAIDTPRKIKDELRKCQESTCHWFDQWGWTADPRPDSPLYTVPFILFPFQTEGIDWLDNLVFKLRSDGLIDKSRDMGVSWLMVGWAVKHWRFATRQQQFHTLFGSRKEELVDKIGDMSTLFEKMRFMIRHMPSWMLPEEFDTSADMSYLRIINPETGSTLIGESSNANFARAGRYSCLEGGTVVPTREGLLTFEELIDRTTSHLFGADGQSKRVRHYIRRPSEQLYTVSAKYGIEITGTADHPLMVYTGHHQHLKLTEKAISEIDEGDYLIVKSLEEVEWTQEEKITPEMSLILGYLVSEGTINTRSKIEFCQKDDVIFDEFKALWKETFNDTLPERRTEVQYRDGSTGSFRSAGGSRAEIREKLFQLGQTRTKSAEKSVPLVVRTSSRRIIRYFLQSLFEGDGCASITDGCLRVSYTSKSKQLVRQLHSLLLLFGIFSSIKFDKKRAIYTLDINGMMASIYQEKIGFRSARKNSVLPESSPDACTLQCPKRDGNYLVKVKRVSPAASAITYDVELEDHQFIANGLLSHNCIVFDEHAAFPDGGFAAWTAASQSSKSKISVSTPQGRLTKQAQLRFSGRIPFKSFKWDLHEWKDERWYTEMCRSMTPVEVAQEIDLSYDASQSGRVYPHYNELYHVITWSEFARLYGEKAIVRDSTGKTIRYRIPLDWSLGRGQDWGSTESHPCVTLWMARAKEGVPLTGSVFTYREMIPPTGSTPAAVARMIKEVEKADFEDKRMALSIMSHEAKAVRDTYNMEHQLQFSAWVTDFNAGVAQVSNYLELIETDKPNPFAPQINGRPRLFLIVDDEEGMLKYDSSSNTPYRVGATSSRGMVRLRSEFPVYHYPETEEGKAVQKMRPFKSFDDAQDVLRCVANQWFPAIKRETTSERIARGLPQELQPEAILKLPFAEQAAALHARSFKLSQLKRANPPAMNWRKKAQFKRKQRQQTFI